MRIKSLLMIIFISINVTLLSQIRIDTLSDDHSVEIYNEEMYSTYTDGSGNKKYLERFKRSRSSKLDWLCNTTRNSRRILNDTTNIYKAGYISSLSLENVCNYKFENIHTKFGSNYLVSKKDSCFLLDNNCKFKFITSLDSNTTVHVRHSTFFCILNKNKSQLLVYNSIGEVISVIYNCQKMEINHDNKYLLFVDENPESEQIFDKIETIYNIEGKLLGKGNVLDYNEEVLIIEGRRKEIIAFYKDEELFIPENVLRVKLDNNNFLRVTLKNGKTGIFSNSLIDTIIEPQYELVRFVNIDENFYARPYRSDRVSNNFFLALDGESKVHIFDPKGNEIDLKKDIYSSPYIFNQVGVFNIGESLTFFTIHEKSDTFHVFDHKWNYISTETKNKTDQYYLLAYGSSPWVQVPISTLRHFLAVLDKEYYIEVHGKNGSKNNIINHKLEFVTENNIKWLHRINNNHFSTSGKYLDQKKDFVIRIKEN